MDLYVFTSESHENIVIGVREKLWAVSPGQHPNFQRGVRTKAKRMPVSSVGIFWSVKRQAFTVPFVVSASPSNDRVVKDIWVGEWIAPFEIDPLGRPEIHIHKSRARSRWPFLQGARNISHRIRMTPTQSFVPTQIANDDWAQILVDLGDRPAAA